MSAQRDALEGTARKEQAQMEEQLLVARAQVRVPGLGPHQSSCRTREVIFCGFLFFFNLPKSGALGAGEEWHCLKGICLAHAH